MPKPYKHLSLEERALMQVWLEHDQTPSAIARKLGRACSTITRELSRNTTPTPVASPTPAPGRPRTARGYRCALAQKRAERLACKPRVARKMVRGNTDLQLGLTRNASDGYTGRFALWGRVAIAGCNLL